MAFLFDMLYFTLYVLIFFSLEIINDIYEQILKKEFELKKLEYLEYIIINFEYITKKDQSAR